MKALIKYDFNLNSFVAELEDDLFINASGDSPQEAVENLRRQVNKHDLLNGVRL